MRRRTVWAYARPSCSSAGATGRQRDRACWLGAAHLRHDMEADEGMGGRRRVGKGGGGASGCNAGRVWAGGGGVAARRNVGTGSCSTQGLLHPIQRTHTHYKALRRTCDGHGPAPLRETRSVGFPTGSRFGSRGQRARARRLWCGRRCCSRTSALHVSGAVDEGVGARREEYRGGGKDGGIIHRYIRRGGAHG